MNSPKPRKHLGNFVLGEASVRRLPRNREGISIVSCTTVISQPDHVVLTPDDACGSLLPEEMLDIVDHIETYGLIERGAAKAWLPDLRQWAEAMGGFRRRATR